MLKPVTHWNLRRLKTTYEEVEAALLKNQPPSPATLERLARVGHMPDPLRERAATESGRVVGHVLAATLRRGKVHWDALTPLVEVVRPNPQDSGLARDMIAYLAGIRAINRYMSAEMTRGSETFFRPHVPALRDVVGRVDRWLPGTRALKILKAGLVSLDDRSAARSLYAEALEEGWNGMASSIFDLGAHTYLSGPEVWSRRRNPEEALPSEAVRQALARRRPPYDRAWINLVWSVDPGFLRIYGPMWFNIAPYLLNEGIGMIMVVAGPQGPRGLAIDEARDLIARSARFRNLPDADAYADAVTFVEVEVPSWVGETKTYYASARYLAALPILEATGKPILIADVDQTLRDPLGPFLKKLKDADVAIPRSRGLALLWPWRRNMAGTGYFAPTNASLGVLKRIRDYITAGLAEDPSWTLDQNALAFALEEASGVNVLDLYDTPRPLHQDNVRTIFEKTWRDGPATPP